MADKYERWNKWAPRFIADLIHDFGFTPEQAAGFVGNFAAESAYFNDIVEDGAIAKGWAGGTGFAQWTAARRKTFEAWIRRKGWAADSYEGNYSYLYRELKGLEPRSLTGLRPDLIQLIKGATTPETAAWRVAKYFEKPKVINTEPRYKAAREALELYRKNPVPPTKWETDKEEVIVPPTTVPIPVVPDTSRPAVPWYKSLVFTGSVSGLGASLVAIAQAYQPGVPFMNQLDTLFPLIIAAVATAVSTIGRVTSTAQPLTTTQGAADKIGEAKAAATAVVAAENVRAGMAATPGLSPAERAEGWTTVRPEDVPLDHQSLVKIRNELPAVADSVLDIVQVLARLSPTLAVLGEVGRSVNALHEASQSAKVGERP